MEHVTKNIDISLIEVNKGQIDGLPQNPRFIRDERFKALVKSIEDAPEMLNLRELLVVEHGKKYVVIGGNMRLRACLDLGYKKVPCKVLPKDTPVAKLREYAIKDNNEFGQDDWDILANEWDAQELEDWGAQIDFLKKDEWEALPDVEEDVKAPSLDKQGKIIITVPVNLEDQKNEIKKIVKEALSAFDGISVE